jgi:hypothetical protein
MSLDVLKNVFLLNLLYIPLISWVNEAIEKIKGIMTIKVGKLVSGPEIMKVEKKQYRKITK